MLIFRLWDLERDDNSVLPLDETLGFERGEMIHCVSYCASKGNCQIIFPQCEQYKLFFFPYIFHVDIVVSRHLISPHSQTLSRNFYYHNATVSVQTNTSSTHKPHEASFWIMLCSPQKSWQLVPAMGA